MDSVLLKQSKPLQVSIYGYVLLVFVPMLFIYNMDALGRILLLCIAGLALVGYSIVYEINKDFNNYKHFSIFGVILFKSKLNLFRPDYISLFSASFKKDNEWGAVAAMVTKSRSNAIVLKFFKGTNHQVVFKCKDYYTALRKADELSALLDVRIHNAFKDSST